MLEVVRNNVLITLAGKLLDDADLQPAQVHLLAFACSLHHRWSWLWDGGGVALVVATDHFMQECGIENGTSDRADLVEGACHSDGAETGHTTISWLDSHSSGESTWLANRTASISAQSEWSFVGCHCGSGTAAGTAWNALSIPWVVGGEVCRMLGG